MRPAPIPVSFALVDSLRSFARTTCDDATAIYGAAHRHENEEWDQWVFSRPGAHRSPLRRLRDEGRGVGWFAWMNGDDHLRSLADLLNIDEGEGPRIWGYLTLSRVAVEAFLRAAYYTETTPPPPTQSLRHASGLVSGLREQLTLSREIGEFMEVSARQYDQITKRVERAGITLVITRNGRPQSLELDGARVNVEFNASDQTRDRLEEMPSAYRYGSAVAHSGLWFLGDAARSTPEDGTDLHPDPNVMVSAVVGACDAAVVSAAAVASPEQQAAVAAMRRRFETGKSEALRILARQGY